MFSIDSQTIDYLRLTGREDEQVKLVELYARHTGLWSDSLSEVQYERVLSPICPAWCATWPVRPTPMRGWRLPIWPPKALPGSGTRCPGQMPDAR
ncbi:hypothetical protein F2S88_32545 [Pseudomonas syringae pv. actinidiae]|nr:hypothetical protein [Pseudomonas syringae pv. actinidiae]